MTEVVTRQTGTLTEWFLAPYNLLRSAQPYLLEGGDVKMRSSVQLQSKAWAQMFACNYSTTLGQCCMPLALLYAKETKDQHRPQCSKSSMGNLYRYIFRKSQGRFHIGMTGDASSTQLFLLVSGFRVHQVRATILACKTELMIFFLLVSLFLQSLFT